MSRMKRALDMSIYELAYETGYDEEFLMDAWIRMCEEAAEDDEDPDWEQFCRIAREFDL